MEAVISKIRQSLINNQSRGFSYASIMVSLVVLQIISLTFVSIVVTTNNATDKANNTIIGTQIAESFLDYAEVAVANTPGLRQDSAAIDYVYQQVQDELDAFNNQSDRYKLNAFFQCDFCIGIDKPEVKSNVFPTDVDFMEVTIEVTHKSSKLLNSSDSETFYINRLVVFQ